MKITKTIGFALAVAVVGLGAWVFVSLSTGKPIVQPKDQIDASKPAVAGAAMVEVRLPAALSAKAATGNVALPLKAR
jgi:hypothetical protein